MVKLFRPGTGAAAVRLVEFDVCTALGLGDIVDGGVFMAAAGVWAPAGVVEGLGAAIVDGAAAIGAIVDGVPAGVVVDGVVLAAGVVP